MRYKLIALLMLLTSCSGGEIDYARSLAVPQPADLILRNSKYIAVDRDFAINCSGESISE